MGLMPNSMKLHCPALECVLTSEPVLLLEMAHEDEEIVQWSGACGRCGREYHLQHPKDAANDNQEMLS